MGSSPVAWPSPISRARRTSLRYALVVRVLDRDVHADALARLQGAIQRSPRVRRLLSERAADGTIPRHPYAKWHGAHWVLAALAELGYPPGDAGLHPLREQVLSWLLSPHRERRIGQPVDGRARFCASQEGNAIYSLLVLGLADARVERLVERLVRTQWPDGGWNCDRRTEADTSSFHETWLPLRALVRYARLTGSLAVCAAADRAAEIFLSRSLFQRRSDGAVMRPSFVQLHYPAYWHYDLLAGLTVMAEGGYIHDATGNEQSVGHGRGPQRAPCRGPSRRAALTHSAPPVLAARAIHYWPQRRAVCCKVLPNALNFGHTDAATDGGRPAAIDA